MKLGVDIDGLACTLELRPSLSGEAQYVLDGAVHCSGRASIAELSPGVFSVLLDTQSFDVRLVPSPDGLEVWIGSARHFVSLYDPRDRSSRRRNAGASGPVELRAQMPGKVIRVMVSPGDTVQTGQGLIVVEAMKMQNEIKSRKDGVVSKIYATDGATVAAGEALLVVE